MSHRTRLLTVSFAAAPVRDAWWRKLLAASSALALVLAALGEPSKALAQHLTVSGDYSYSTPTGTPPAEADWAVGDLDIGASDIGGVTISDGFSLWTENLGRMGLGSAGDGTMTVTGAGTLWDVIGETIVGESGTGTLSIEAGGHVRSSYQAPSNDGYGASIGSGTGSTGTVTVTGDGSLWDVYAPLLVGDAGDGTLNVEDNAEVLSADAYIANRSGSTGHVTVTDGSYWSAQKLVVGGSGEGTLTVKDNAWVQSKDAELGSTQGSKGTVNVSDSGFGGGQGWTIESGSLTVGNSGTAFVNVTDGGYVGVQNGTTSLGANTGSVGTVTINGTDSRFNTSTLFVGNSGSGYINVEAGGALNSGATYIAHEQHSAATITVTGAGSTWNKDGGADVYVGYSGGGSLNVLDLAEASAANAYIGYNSGSSGFVTVTGNGAVSGAAPTSVWNTGTLTVGKGGQGHLTVQSGGQAWTDGDSQIAVDAGSTGIVTIQNKGSTWYQLGGMRVGAKGTGTLDIYGGAVVYTDGGSSYLGSDTNSKGTVTVSGAGSLWDTREHIVNIGYGGHGILNVESGGGVEVRSLNIGGNGQLFEPSQAIGEVTVTGAGSLLRAEDIWVASAGQGTLTVDKGGVVETGGVAMGLNGSDVGTINLNGTDGARGVLQTAGIVSTISGHNYLNFDGGILRATANGALVSDTPQAPIAVSLLEGGGFIDTNGHNVSMDKAMSGEGGLTKLGEGTLTLNGGNGYEGVTQVEQGTLVWGGGFNSGGFVQRGQYVVNGGTLDFGANHGSSGNPAHYSLTMSSLSGTGGTVQLNLADLIVDQATDTEYEGSIAGSGGLTKKGDGSLTLNGDSTYTGGTFVDDGMLVVNGSLAGDVQVNDGGTLGGTGTIGGDAVNGGTLAAGNSIGTLTVAGDFTQTAGGVLAIEADFANASIDRLVVGGDARLAGAIRIDAKSVLPDVELNFLTVGGTLTHLLDAESALFDYELVERGGGLSLSAGSAHFAEPGAALNDDQHKVATHLQEVWDAGGGSFGTLFGTLGSLADADTDRYASALSDLSFGASGAAAANSIVMTQQHLDLLLSCPTFAAGSAVLTETECVWSQAGGQLLDQKASAGISGFDNTTYSLQAGVQREVSPDWFVGFAGGYDRSSIDSDDGRVASDGDTLYAGVSLKHETGPWLLSGALAGSYGWFDNTRAIAIPGFAGQAEGDQDIYNLSARMRAAYTIAYDNSYVRPLVDLDLIYAHAGSYRETGAGALDLAVDDASQWSFHVTPAVEVGTRVALGETTVMRAFAAAGVSFGTADSWDTSARLANAPAGVGGFDSEVPLADVVGRLTAGVDLANDNGFSVRAQYSGAFSDTYTSHGGSLRLSYKF